jgi:hypothetical protein
MKRLMVLVVIAVSLALIIAGGSAASPPTIDGVLSVGEWDGSFWFTDNSEGPGTGYDDDPLPVFTGYLCFDETNLYLAFDVEDTTLNTNSDFLYVTIDIPPAGVFNDPVDALYWGSVPANTSFFGEAYLTGDLFPWDRSQRGSTWGTDGGVVTARTITDEHRYYELKIPLAAIGASLGDTIGLKIQARGGQRSSSTDPQVVNYFPDMPDGITPIRADTRVEVEGNFCQLTLGPQEIEVGVDIKPGSDPNSINLGSKGVVPVAVLTTDDFDAATVDPGTVVFAGASPVRWTMEDVDGDGNTDLLFHFKMQELSLTEHSTEASLTGDTYDGTLIVGTDTVNIVPQRGKKSVELDILAIADQLQVLPCPNPVRDVHTTTFRVMGAMASMVEAIRVQIYDLSGHLVWEDAALGSELDWHTDSLSGDYLANGIYLYRVQVRIGGSWINQDIGKIAVLR